MKSAMKHIFSKSGRWILLDMLSMSAYVQAASKLLEGVFERQAFFQLLASN